MSKNDVTGDSLVTKASTNLYREGWDRVFGVKNKKCDHVWTSCQSGIEVCDACDETRLPRPGETDARQTG